MIHLFSYGLVCFWEVEDIEDVAKFQENVPSWGLAWLENGVLGFYQCMMIT